MTRTRITTTLHFRAGRCALVLGLAAGSAAFAQPTLDVTPASAPNTNSPSWQGWASNALYAIENGLSSWGTPGGPTYYQAASATMGVKENMVTSFNSWNGSANPGGDYGAAYAGEFGNRLAFGVSILGNGTQFSISQLSFVGDSTDSGNTLDFAFGEGGYAYSTHYVGIDYVDGIKGNGNDVIVTGGPSTRLVDELIGRGSHNAWWPQVPAHGPTPQEAIDNVAATLNADTPFYFTGTYSLNLGNGNFVSGLGSVQFVPTPGAGALIVLGAASCGVRRRRR